MWKKLYCDRFTEKDNKDNEQVTTPDDSDSDSDDEISMKKILQQQKRPKVSEVASSIDDWKKAFVFASTMYNLILFSQY